MDEAVKNEEKKGIGAVHLSVVWTESQVFSGRRPCQVVPNVQHLGCMLSRAACHWLWCKGHKASSGEFSGWHILPL